MIKKKGRQKIQSPEILYRSLGNDRRDKFPVTFRMNLERHMYPSQTVVHPEYLLLVHPNIEKVIS